MLTREEKTVRFVEEISEKTRKSEESPLTLRSSTSSRLDVVSNWATMNVRSGSGGSRKVR